MIVKKLLIISSAYLLAACGAGATREPCPTVEAEPVSTCRAIEKCRSEKTSYGMGVGFGIGRNIGIGISQSQSSEAYTNCVDLDLKNQENLSKAKAKASGEGAPGLQPGNTQ